MSKAQELNKLFGEWQKEHKFEVFCKDGIVDEDEFGKNMPEVVFLLKDANAENQDEADVCKNLSDTANYNSPFGKMWKVLCMWTKIIKEPEVRYSDCCDKNNKPKASMCEYLKNIAVVNLSKEHGKGTNKQSELDAKISDSMRDYYGYTTNELDIIDPVLVVCCGTYHYLLEKYGVYDKVLPSGARYFTKDSKIFLEMPHPGIRISYPVLFAYFKEVYSDLPLIKNRR